ncbi:MAG: hypothetical protein AAFO81_14760 [Pseudomonadota bacterium]
MNGFSQNIFRAAIFGIVLILTTTGGDAYAQRSAFVMSAIENEAAGDEILAGDYAGAADLLSEGDKLDGDAFSKANNLCVALTLGGQIDDAERQCNEALYHSRIHRRSIESRVDVVRFRAVALSNRGVLKAISGDLDGAEQDFEQAAKISSRLQNAALNLEHLRDLRQRLTASTSSK